MTAPTNSLVIESLHVELSKKLILQNISLSLEHAEIGCLLGPSGCGKTTLLRSIAGFIRPTLGQIKIADNTVSDSKHVVAVEKRAVGMVFQDFALFPHLTVYDNISFGLKNLNLTKPIIEARVAELLVLIELTHKSESYPHELSGGQQQRVALARALAPKPSIILLDEPFSSIDRSMRDALAFKVREILKKEQATTIMVTHDQAEAYAMADKIGVMNNGQLQQWQTPMQIYQHPVNKFVASFIGESVFIKTTVISKNCISSALGKCRVSQDFAENEIGTSKVLLVRPDDVMLDPKSSIEATVIHRFFKGASFVYMLALKSDEHIHGLLVQHNIAPTQPYREMAKHNLDIGQTVKISSCFKEVHVYDVE